MASPTYPPIEGGRKLQQRPQGCSSPRAAQEEDELFRPSQKRSSNLYVCGKRLGEGLGFEEEKAAPTHPAHPVQRRNSYAESFAERTFKRRLKHKTSLIKEA